MLLLGLTIHRTGINNKKKKIPSNITLRSKVSIEGSSAKPPDAIKEIDREKKSETSAKYSNVLSIAIQTTMYIKKIINKSVILSFLIFDNIKSISTTTLHRIDYIKLMDRNFV
jgi:hypothetical protein